MVFVRNGVRRDASSVSLQKVRIVPPDSSVSVEEVLLAAGEQVGHDKL